MYFVIYLLNTLRATDNGILVNNVLTSKDTKVFIHSYPLFCYRLFYIFAILDKKKLVPQYCCKILVRNLAYVYVKFVQAEQHA